MNFANLNIQAMQPYCPPLEGRMNYEGLLLDFNERSVPPSPKVFSAIQAFLEKKQLNRYPEYFDFCDLIADYANAETSQVMVTNGSDQGIDLIFRTFTQKDDEVIIPSPSFAMFYQCAGVIENKIIMPSYRPDDLSFPFEEILEVITPQTKLIVLCNPNNPTGTPITLEQIEIILRKAPSSIVYVDEAYYEFSKTTAIPLVKKYPNLIITRTFSKAFGLVALRIGYIISQSQNIQEILKVRGPYDMNALSYYAAKATLEDIQDTEKYIDEVMNKSKPMVESSLSEKGVQFFESKSNFLLVDPQDSTEIISKLDIKGVRVRALKKKGIEGMFRLTIGTEKQMQKFCRIFSSCL